MPYKSSLRRPRMVLDPLLLAVLLRYCLYERDFDIYQLPYTYTKDIELPNPISPTIRKLKPASKTNLLVSIKPYNYFYYYFVSTKLSYSNTIYY